MTKPSLIGGLFSARRICVTGANGAGKTVFGDVLADALGLPLFRNDAFTLTQDWQCRSVQEVTAQRQTMAKQDKWILEGGPSIVGPNGVASCADIIVWLDVPRLLRCYRIIRRTQRYTGTTRPDLPDGNPERFDRHNLRFTWKAWRNHECTRQAIMAGTKGLNVLHLRSRSDVRATLDLLSGPHTPGQSAKLL